MNVCRSELACRRKTLCQRLFLFAKSTLNVEGFQGFLAVVFIIFYQLLSCGISRIDFNNYFPLLYVAYDIMLLPARYKIWQSSTGGGRERGEAQ